MLESTTSANGWSPSGLQYYNYTPNAPTYNTNYISLGNTSSTNYSGVGTKNKVSGSMLHGVLKGVTAVHDNTSGKISRNSYKNLASEVDSHNLSSTGSLVKLSVALSGSDEYVMAGSVSNRYCEIYALWYE